MDSAATTNNNNTVYKKEEEEGQNAVDRHVIAKVALCTEHILSKGRRRRGIQTEKGRRKRRKLKDIL